MGVQLEPISQTLEQYGPWHFGDIRFQQDRRAELEAALLQTAAIPGLSDRLLEISKASRADCHSPSRPEVTLSVSKVPKSVAQGPSGPAPDISTRPATAKPCRSLFPATVHASLGFTRLTPSGKPVVTFPLSSPPPQPRPCLKRRRPDTDVDGHNTSSLGCKKRRLLRHLITSRLSQPYSLPATHILNRESITTGDKRFLKLSAIMSARRLNSTVTAQPQTPQPPQQPSPSTWLRRAAVLNSLRSRVCAAAAERANGPASDDLAAKAAVFRQGHGSTAFVSGRYLADAPRGPGGIPGAPTPPQLHSPAAQKLGGPPQPPGLRLPGSNSIHTQSATGPVHIHIIHGSALPSPLVPNATTTTTTRLRIPSPKLRPLRSPELRITRPLVPLEDIHGLLDDDDADDDSMAFPTSELESRYEDDPEDEEGGGGVYADFSVIFGGGDGEDEDDEGEMGSGSGTEHFEDYMDDLDGIPWGARC